MDLYVAATLAILIGVVGAIAYGAFVGLFELALRRRAAGRARIPVADMPAAGAADANADRTAA